MSVHLKIEESPKGLMATLWQRDEAGKVIGHPSVGIVASAVEAKRLAKTLARSLGLKVYGVVDKTRSAPRPVNPPGIVARTVHRDAEASATTEEPPPWLVPGVSKSL